MLCCVTGPVFLFVAYAAWRDGAGPQWVLSASGFGAVVTAVIPVSALKAARADFPRITARDRAREGAERYGEESFVVWAPRSAPGPAGVPPVRADVLEARFVRYEPDGEATFTTYGGNFDPAEVKPVVWLRLRVHGTEPYAGGAEGADFEVGQFEVGQEVRVPPLCLSAVTAGRLAVLVGPAARAPGADAGPVTVLWPRSLLLAGTRTCRVTGLDGRTTEVTRRVRRQLAQIRVSWSVGGVLMDGDTIDLRRLDPDTAARYSALADGPEEERAPVTEPGEETRLLTALLPGEPGEFGSVGRRWSRRGGRLVRARFLSMAGTTTFQAHGPHLDVRLRIRPADGSPAFDAVRRITVPMNYLALLHRTRDVVLQASPDGSAYIVDWPRTNLLAGVTEAGIVTPDGREIPLSPRSQALWPLMNLLCAEGISVRGAVLDLRRPRLRRVSEAVLALVAAEEETGAAGARLS
nr:MULTISPECIES: hypothetical protein [unclassified Streptomyces]